MSFKEIISLPKIIISSTYAGFIVDNWDNI